MDTDWQQDFYALAGQVETREATLSLECAGVVRRVGEKVTGFVPGDSVVVMAPGKYSTVERVPAWACCKLNQHESFEEMATIPIVVSSALYALRNRANLQAGESVLIHSATGGVGQAAIQIAKHMKAEIYATVGTEEKRQHVRDVYDIADDHIFSSRDVSFQRGIMKATEGRGVDVVLNSLTRNQLDASWECCAEFGRFVELGKYDITKGSKLDMSILNRSTSFSAFDLTDLYYSTNPQHNRTWSR